MVLTCLIFIHIKYAVHTSTPHPPTSAARKVVFFLQDSNWSCGNPHTASKLCDLLQPNMERFGSRYAKCTHSQVIASKHECLVVFSSNFIPSLLRQLDTPRLPSSVPQLIKDIHLLHPDVDVYNLIQAHRCSWVPMRLSHQGGGWSSKRRRSCILCKGAQVFLTLSGVVKINNTSQYSI